MRVPFVRPLDDYERRVANWLDGRLIDEPRHITIKDEKIICWRMRFTTARNLLDVIYYAVGLSTTLDVFDSSFWVYWLRKVKEAPVPKITRICVGPSAPDSQSFPDFKDLLPNLCHLALTLINSDRGERPA